MSRYEIIWPEDFADYAWEVESKGCLFGVKAKVGSEVLEPVFYDKVRLLQDVETELERSGHFAEPVVIVLDRVTPQAIEQVIERMTAAGTLEQLARSR